MLKMKIGILILAWVTSSLCDIPLFPIGKELTYQWRVNVSSGTVKPAENLTKWDFEASLVIQQQNDNLTVFQIKDFHSRGTFENISALLLPFEVSFTNGELTALSVDGSDEEWSINMKRALVSIIQFKVESIMIPSFISQETNHYGKCAVEYETIILSPEKVKVRKIIDHESCTNFPNVHFSNCPLAVCPGTYQNIIASDSERQYIITPYDAVSIKYINATGSILVQPYQAHAEAHYIMIRQFISFVSVEKVVKPITIEPESEPVDLVYETSKLDPTYGKKPTNKTKIISEIYNQLGELSDSLSTWEVGVKGLDNETSFHLLDLMWWLEVEDWEKLHSAISLGTSYRQETIQNLFWDLVPHVGSRSAVLFIRKLVINSQVKGFLAARLLVSFPFHLREVSEELLTQCEDLLRLGNGIAPEIKQYAVLGFASMIFKTCKLDCKTDTLDRYAKLYLDKFIESTVFEEKILYLQGLSNMELNQVLDFLAPVIAGVSETNKDLRFLAVWVTMHTVYSNPNKVYEVYWPLFINKSESLEMRVAALTLLIMSKPSTARFFSIYWHMQAESSEQLYNFYYTTITSLANTNYPCYLPLSQVAARFARFVPAKSRHWATGNYILDFEDPDRAYGGLLQTLLIASEHTGLPNIFMFIVEQHSLGHSRTYALYLKTEGLPAALYAELTKISSIENINEKMSKVFQLLQTLEVPLRSKEKLHLELIAKIDGRTVMIQYINQTTFTNLTQAVKRLSSLYVEFSVNYQSLSFPIVISTSRPTDLGVPSLTKIRSASVVSTRGSISQENEGKARNAELDLRYSWNGVTTLRVYNPFDNTWYGADRCRNIHIRLPFATHLILQVDKSVIKVKAVRHRDFVTGSRLGLVWHASTRLVSKKSTMKTYPNIKDEWTMDSEDLGVRLGASVFDCSSPDTLPEVLHLLKKAFLANHKNYNMVPGGVVFLGLLSLRDQLQFQPQGLSCGVILYFTPLLTKVEPEFLIESDKMRLSMTRQDGLLWEIQAGSKKLPDGNKEFVFKLYRAPSVSVSVAHIWRVIQFEGAFIVPSRISGVSNSPTALTGYAFVSWGDASPSQADKAAMLDLKVAPPRPSEDGGPHCRGFTPGCLQAASDLAARQTATLQYANLPEWLKMTAHALFPEQFQTESSQTQVTFAYPVALLPWNTKGLCAVNSGSVLTLDNATIPYALSECYSLAVADCSDSQFSVQVKKLHNLMAAQIYCGNDSVELLPSQNKDFHIHVNGNILDDIKQGYQHIEVNRQQLSAQSSIRSVRMRSEGIIEVELTSGVSIQLYNTTAVVLIPAKFRGNTCGLCGDFNGDIINEPVLRSLKCEG